MLHFLQTEGQTQHQQGWLRCSGLGPHPYCPHGVLTVDAASLSGLWHGLAFEDTHRAAGVVSPLVWLVPSFRGPRVTRLSGGPSGFSDPGRVASEEPGRLLRVKGGAGVGCHLPSHPFMLSAQPAIRGPPSTITKCHIYCCSTVRYRTGLRFDFIRGLFKKFQRIQPAMWIFV